MNKTRLSFNKKIKKRYLNEIKFHNYMKNFLAELGINLLS